MNCTDPFDLRSQCAELVADFTPRFVGRTELELAEALREVIYASPDLYDSGWYDPPPQGISVLAARSPWIGRLNFDSLRRRDFWPGDIQIYSDSIVIVYASPVVRSSRLIADWGGTVYLGKNAAIHQHCFRCQRVMREIATSIQPDMAFSEIYRYAQARFKKDGLSNDSTVSDSDSTRTNLGHTVPFSFGYDFPRNYAADNQDFRVQISTARRFINAQESLKVPQNGAFTFEARLVDLKNSDLPNVLVHLMLRVANGVVTVH